VAGHQLPAWSASGGNASFILASPAVYETVIREGYANGHAAAAGMPAPGPGATAFAMLLPALFPAISLFLLVRNRERFLERGEVARQVSLQPVRPELILRNSLILWLLMTFFVYLGMRRNWEASGGWSGLAIVSGVFLMLIATPVYLRWRSPRASAALRSPEFRLKLFIVLSLFFSITIWVAAQFMRRG
jgi:hypothetical protein